MSKEQIEKHLFGPGPKRILSLDGGGVHGLTTLGMLKKAESILGARSRNPDTFKLSDYFDLIGGTSTGAIIASLLAFGYRVDQIVKLYLELCPEIFGKRRLRNLFLMGSKFDSKKFADAVNRKLDLILNEKDGAGPANSRPNEPTLGTTLLETGLAIFTKRIDKPNVWVFTNNPKAKYWADDTAEWREFFSKRGETFYANKDYSLRNIVIASASAPYYLDAVEIEIDPRNRGLFLDGGVSPHNNPSAGLFMMTALNAYGEGGNGRGADPFGFSWKTGKDELFMLSLGTGVWRDDLSAGEFTSKWFANKSIIALSSMIRDCQMFATSWLQALSEPRAGDQIDANLEDMKQLRILPEPLLTFRRVNPRYENEWLRQNFGEDWIRKALDKSWLVESPGKKVGLSPEKLELLRQFDKVGSGNSNLKVLLAIGEEAGRRLIEERDFPASFDLPEWRTYEAPPAKRFLAGVTGHRPNRLPKGANAKLIEQLDSALAEIERANPNRRFALLSGLAEGADRLAADAALKRGWQLSAVLPFTRGRYLQDFEHAASKADFERLLNQCSRVLELASGDRAPNPGAPYTAQGAEIAETCDALIAIWDGEQAQGPGGTVDVVRAALQRRMPVTWINAAQDVPPKRLSDADLPQEG